MSLINEALKKARLEAAQRDAAQRGVLVPKATAYAPRRGGGRIVAVAAAGILALALAAAGGMWLAGRSGPNGAEAVAQSAETAAAGAPPGSVPETPPAGPGLPQAAPAAPPRTEADPAPSRPAAAAIAADPELAPTRAVTADPETDPATAPVRSATAEGETEPAAPRRPAGARSPRPAPSAAGSAAYVREAPLPGGGAIRLDGIAWSETTPAAVIDGQIVGPGERVQGARVVRIERDLVVFEVAGSELIIRLR